MARAEDLASELKQVGVKRRRAMALRRETSEALADLVPRARAAGITVTEIAELTGLTRVGVYEFLKD